MAYEPHPNPQPVTISSQPISVTVGETIVADTDRYFNPDLADNTDETIESNLDTGTVIDIISLSFATVSTSVMVVTIKSVIGISDSSVLCKFYCVGSLQITPNVKFTVPGAGNNDLVIHIERADETSETADLSVSMVYRLTAP